MIDSSSGAEIWVIVTACIYIIFDKTIMQVRAVRFSVRTKYRTIYIKIINYILSSNQKYIVKNVILLFLLFGLFYSCSKKESTPPTPPVVTKLSGCDSIKQGLLKTTSDTIRLVSCLTISGCDSVRLGLLKPSTTDTIRLVSCLSISGCDSVRLGLLKPSKADTIRLSNCIKISGCDSVRLGILKPSKADTIRLLFCLKITGCDSIRLGLINPSTADTIRLSNCFNISSQDSIRLGILNIGQQYLGGTIAYILIPGDPGYDAKIKHGIIASTSDLSTGISWSNGRDVVTGAKSTAILKGYENTGAIIRAQGVLYSNYAAGLAFSYNGGGYDDWCLPSRDELNILYLNQTRIGNFTKSSTYWSSSEAPTVNGVSLAAWGQSFFDGSRNTSPYPSKGNKFAVRAIRYF